MMRRREIKRRRIAVSKIRFHQSNDIEWKDLRSVYPPTLAAELTDAELDSTMADHESGSDGSLHLSEYRYLPHASFELHAHSVSEIIYVLEGTIVFGNRELGTGSSVFIEKDTLYGFTAGAKGLRALIFMGTGCSGYFGEEEYLRLRAESKVAAS
jgi:mannose-6-phosphate isomerase-like protein (cupin superfamily)